MVSRLMLNLRREALRRKPILDYRVTNPGGGGGADSQEVARFAVMTSTWAMEPEGQSTQCTSGISASRTFEQSLVGNLGAEVMIWGDDEEEDEGLDEKDSPDRQAGLELSTVRKEIQVHITEEIVVVNDGSVAPLTTRSRRTRRLQPTL